MKMRVAIGVEQFKQTLNSLDEKPLSAAIVTKGGQVCLCLDFGRMTYATDDAQGLVEGEEGRDGPPVRIRADGVGCAESLYESYSGEVTLSIWCNWRIELGETQILCGSQDSAEDGRSALNGIRELMGDTVADVSLSSFLDLLVVFGSGKRLRLFCDQSGHENNDDCYQLSVADGETYGVVTGLIQRITRGDETGGEEQDQEE